MVLSDPPNRLDTRRLLELVAVLTLSISIAGLIAMRLGAFQATQIWVIGALVTFAYARLKVGGGGSVPDAAPFWHLVLVIGVALFFRLPPYVYLLGGQDEGVYVNMAHELVRTGGLVPADSVLGRLSDPAMRDLYLQSNYQPTTYLPGVYATEGGLQFQFYHLFPVWLAMFGSIFGVAGAGYGLIFLSLVSLLFFQRLAHLISGQARVGLVAGLLLAVNPLHAFFSKFPVTEVPTLAFSTMSFAFLLTYWRSPKADGAKRYLVISLAALGMLFMTRISGFMYLPLLLVFLFVGLVVDRRNEGRSGLMVWAAAAIWLYFLSVLYGLKWSTNYATDIYMFSFAPLLGEGWKQKLLMLGAAAGLAWMMAWWASQRDGTPALARRGLSLAARVLPLLALLFTTIAVWKAYRLGYTDAYAEHPWLGKHFSLSHRGLRSVGSVSLIASAAYLSPFMLLAFVAASFRSTLGPLLQLLLFFVVCFFGSLSLVQWALFYQPYYARYLLSEFVPYLILFVVCAWGSTPRGKLRAGVAAALVLSGIYCAGLSAFQLGKNEHAGVIESLDRVALRIDQGDIVIVDRELNMPLAHELKTTLVFTYGLNVVTMSDDDMLNERYVRTLAKPYEDMYLLTRSPSAPPGFVEVDSVHFSERIFRHGATPPIAMESRADSRLMIYKHVGSAPVAGEAAIELSADDAEVVTAVGTKIGGKLVASGKAGYLMFGPYRPLPAGNYTIVVTGSGSGPFALDAVARQGKLSLASKEFAAAEVAGIDVLAKLDFALPHSVRDLEVRINVPEGSDLKVGGYKIVHR
jgi:hypothetical protein